MTDSHLAADPDDTGTELTWPPAWLGCRRTQPISGTWEGASARPGAPTALLRSVLELRIDIDERHANSPVMNRVSADHFRVVLPGAASRVYLESWIIDAPTVRWQRCEVQITGRVRWWRGLHPMTTARIQIPWTSASLGPATVMLVETGGATRTYTCTKRSSAFRRLDLEIDVCRSVNVPPLRPSYNTHAHANRPAALPQRTLTIEEAYRESGVEVTVAPAHTVINDSAPGFASWTAAELHDAMEVHYSRFGAPWPAWRMWGVLAGRYVNAGTGGIMFDAATAFGGAGEAPERQGFAVFRRHQWFDDLPRGAPANQDEAWALRHYLYTWVHEAGHAFNFLHSWNKNRPNALSWMNYDWRYDQVNGADAFWRNFAFRFDDEELIHLRHGDRPSVIMGGDPWSSGGHLESPPSGAMAQLVEGQPQLELLIRSKGYFEFMEPVVIELRLRNDAPVPIEVDASLRPEVGSVAVYVQRPDGRTVEYAPLMCELALPEAKTLAAKGSGDGLDRHSAPVFIGYGRDGFLFDVPGRYLIRALYQGLGDELVTSNTHPVRVGTPATREEDELAGEFFKPDVGLSLYLRGSQSPFLAEGMATLERIAQEQQGTMLGTRAAETVASSVAQPFFRLEDAPEDEDADVRLVEAHEPEPERAIELTTAAADVYRETTDPRLNIDYHRLARVRAEAFAAAGDAAAGAEELMRLHGDLEQRGVHTAVLDDIRTTAEQLGS